MANTVPPRRSQTPHHLTIQDGPRNSPAPILEALQNEKVLMKMLKTLNRVNAETEALSSSHGVP